MTDFTEGETRTIADVRIDGRDGIMTFELLTDKSKDWFRANFGGPYIEMIISQGGFRGTAPQMYRIAKDLREASISGALSVLMSYRGYEELTRHLNPTTGTVQ